MTDEELVLSLWDDSGKALEETVRLRSLLQEAVAVLEVAEAVLDNYSDAEIDENGRTIGNDAMGAYMDVQATLSKIKGAA